MLNLLHKYSEYHWIHKPDSDFAILKRLAVGNIKEADFSFNIIRLILWISSQIQEDCTAFFVHNSVYDAIATIYTGTFPKLNIS